MHTAPPTIDPVATARWQRVSPASSPWLHEEVGQRMQERLQWIVRDPQVWCDWEPVRGGAQTHELVAQRYPKAQCHIVERDLGHQQAARARWQSSGWGQWLRRQPAVHFDPPAPRSLDMLWSNMGLHLEADPQQLLQTWATLVKPEGFVMFSCLGPDTVQQLRDLYAAQGWPPAGHQFTDMHDLGDMLVQHGFAEPVMDMERIHLQYSDPARLWQELRELGRNFHPQRFAGLRTPRWKKALEASLAASTAPSQPLTLTFEIIYGHAFRAPPKATVQPQSSIALDDMRSMLQRKR